MRFLFRIGIFAFSMMSASARSPEVTVVRTSIVNDSIPDAMLPMGLVRSGTNGLIAAFCDGVDFKPGSRGYLVRSDDNGKTWGQPFLVLEPDAPNIGIAAGLVGLPNGNILLIETVETYLSDDLTWDAVFKPRTSDFRLRISTDGGRTFHPAGSLPFAKNAAGAVIGQITALANGDLIIPGFQYPGGLPSDPGTKFGSGFFRSVDGGLTWGEALEIAFQDPVPGRERPLSFSEASYLVRPDGSIVGFARIDSEKLDGDAASQWQSRGNNMWRVESKDNGSSWSVPVETDIGGLFPVIAMTETGKYLMVCGNRHADPTRKVCFYTSNDGIDFQLAGYAPYMRTNGVCVSSATGGSQCLAIVGKETFYLVYFAADPELPSEYHTYIEGCLLKVK